MHASWEGNLATFYLNSQAFPSKQSSLAQRQICARTVGVGRPALGHAKDQPTCTDTAVALITDTRVLPSQPPPIIRTHVRLELATFSLL